MMLILHGFLAAVCVLAQWEDGCSSVTSPTECLDEMSPEGVMCAYCAMDQKCHDVGSFENHCPQECCASKSMSSRCDHGSIDRILKARGPECMERPKPTNTTPYKWEQAAIYQHFSSISYCPPDKIQNWTCTTCVGSLQHFAKPVSTKVVYNSTTETQAFVTNFDDGFGIRKNVITFRGTMQKKMKNWLVDFDVRQISPYPAHPEIKVHQGFWRAYMSLRESLMKQFYKFSLAPVIITGHSLGGAMAQLCAYDLARNHARIEAVYTYGSPRVGNWDFHLNYKAAVKTSWRITHRGDAVVNGIPQGMGFYHTNGEIYYDDDSTTNYRVCDSSGEDPQCANRCIFRHSCTSIKDHSLYLGSPFSC